MLSQILGVLGCVAASSFAAIQPKQQQYNPVDDLEYVVLGNFTYSSSVTFESDNSLVAIYRQYQSYSSGNFLSNSVYQANPFSTESSLLINQSVLTQPYYDIMFYMMRYNVGGAIGSYYYLIDFFYIPNRSGAPISVGTYNNFKIGLTLSDNDFPLMVNTYFKYFDSYSNGSDFTLFGDKSSNSLGVSKSMDRIMDSIYDGQYPLFTTRFIIAHPVTTDTGTPRQFNFTLFGSHFDESEQSAYDSGYQNGYSSGESNGYAEGENEGYQSGYNDGLDRGYDNGFEDGKAEGQQIGFNDGLSYGTSQNQTALTIFAGIIDVGLLPVNIFLAILNYEVFGINIGGFVFSLMTIAMAIIIYRLILGGKNDS